MILNVDLSNKAKGVPNRINSEINNVFNQSDFVSTERKETSILVKVIREKNIYNFQKSKNSKNHFY